MNKGDADPEIVARNNIYAVTTMWGRRAESIETLATRWITLIKRLQGLHPAFADWSHWDDGKGSVAFGPRVDVQVARLLERTDRNVAGEWVPGSRVSNVVNRYQRSRHFTADLSGGHDNSWNYNHTIFSSDSFAVPEPELVTYRIFRGVTLAMAKTFQVTQAIAWPSDLSELWADPRGVGEQVDLAWITYIAPRFAHLVTPPEDVVVEHRPDGGLLMAATDDRFSTADPVHLAAARRIAGALEGFNAVPWTVETGK